MGDREAGAAQMVVVVRRHGPDAGTVSELRPCGKTKEPADKNNVVPAKVIRQVFLGSSRDYMVEAQDGTQLRIVTEADGSIAPGAPVWLRMPPERCRALAG